MSSLLIVESSNKIKKISHYLDEIGMPACQVMASLGHIRDLPLNELGVDLTRFQPTYYVSSEKEGLVKKLKTAADKADTIYLATDPDREGESIAWHLSEALQLQQLGKSVYRIKFNQLNKKTIQQALENKGPIDMHLVAAQEARRVLDRLIGYLVSPRLGNRLSAGRVQSPALRLVVEREAEITGFTSTTHYDVKASIPGETPWFCLWHHQVYRSKEQAYWLDLPMAQRIATVTELTVMSVKKGQRQSKAPAPFTTASLQQAASVALKFSPDKTMEVAQQLFAQGAITYHRTDSPNLSDEAIANIGEALRLRNVQPISPPNRWQAKASAQEAHEAIRPVDCLIPLAGESEEQQSLYQMIWQRTLVSQMEHAVFDVMDIQLQGNVVVPIDGKPAVFTAHGETLTDQKGWRRFLAKPHEEVDEGDNDETKEQPLPVVTQGQRFAVTADVLNKQTKPPSRYTEALLIKKLESLEIGRPSTYAAILNNIHSRDYVLINRKRQLEPTTKGAALIQTLLSAHFSFLEYDWTKAVENRLDAIALATDRYGVVVSSIFQVLDKELNGLPDLSQRQVTEVTGSLCQCGGAIDVSERTYQCRSCQAVVWKIMSNRTIEQGEALALLAGETVYLDGFMSKSKNPFAAHCHMDAGKVAFLFEDSPSSNDSTLGDGRCQCGGNIRVTAKQWHCVDCQATVWKRISERTVSHQEAMALLAGDKLSLTGFVSRAGKQFDAIVVIENGKTVFVFDS